MASHTVQRAFEVFNQILRLRGEHAGQVPLQAELVGSVARWRLPNGISYDYNLPFRTDAFVTDSTEGYLPKELIAEAIALSKRGR